MPTLLKCAIFIIVNTTHEKCCLSVFPKFYIPSNILTLKFDLPPFLFGQKNKTLKKY